jgi:hypothetical protein
LAGLHEQRAAMGADADGGDVDRAHDGRGRRGEGGACCRRRRAPGRG